MKEEERKGRENGLEMQLLEGDNKHTEDRWTKSVARARIEDRAKWERKKKVEREYHRMIREDCIP